MKEQDNVRKEVGNIIHHQGFNQKELKDKIEITEQLLEEIIKEVAAYRKLNSRILDAPADSLIIGFKGKDILKLYNKNIACNSHSLLRNVASLAKLNNKDFETKRDLIDEIEKKTVYAHHILAKLRDYFANLR